MDHRRVPWTEQVTAPTWVSSRDAWWKTAISWSFLVGSYLQKKVVSLRRSCGSLGGVDWEKKVLRKKIWHGAIVNKSRFASSRSLSQPLIRVGGITLQKFHPIISSAENMATSPRTGQRAHHWTMLHLQRLGTQGLVASTRHQPTVPLSVASNGPFFDPLGQNTNNWGHQGILSKTSHCPKSSQVSRCPSPQRVTVGFCC